MAVSTKGNQVFFGIDTAMAAKFPVVNLQVRPGPTTLASPSVTPQHLLAKSFVQLGLKSRARLFGENPVHKLKLDLPQQPPPRIRTRVPEFPQEALRL
jgi:hypothetical protein